MIGIRGARPVWPQETHGDPDALSAGCLNPGGTERRDTDMNSERPGVPARSYVLLAAALVPIVEEAPEMGVALELAGEGRALIDVPPGR